MLYFLPGPVKGILTIALLALVTVPVALLLCLLALLRLLPQPAWRQLVDQTMRKLTGRFWLAGVQAAVRLSHRPAWQVDGVEALRPDGRYLIVSNHRSWADGVAILLTLRGRTPFPVCLVKAQLLWVPFIGLGLWALGFPLLRRNKSGRDLEETQRACRRLLHGPMALLTFLEGTRFTEAKHQAQQSPYQHLLKPKAGGISIALGALATAGDGLDGVVDITVAYPPGDNSVWAMACGRLPRLALRVKMRPVPTEAVGDYRDRAARQATRAWVNDLWAQKDKEYQALLTELQPTETPLLVP